MPSAAPWGASSPTPSRWSRCGVRTGAPARFSSSERDLATGWECRSSAPPAWRRGDGRPRRAWRTTAPAPRCGRATTAEPRRLRDAAPGDGLDAAGMEAASGRGMQEAGRLARRHVLEPARVLRVRVGDGGKERPGVGVLGVLDQLVGLSLLDHGPAVHDEDALGEV